MGRELKTVVVVVPFPAHGHLNQLLHFSLHLSSTGLPVHFACTAAHNRQAKARIQGWDAKSVDAIHFHHLLIPPFSNANPDLTTVFPSHLLPMFEASDHLRPQLLHLFRSLSPTCDRLVVVNEPLTSYAGIDALTLPNAEVYRYHCLPASVLPSFFHPEDLLKLPKYDASANIEMITRPLDDIHPKEFDQFGLRRCMQNPRESGTIINSCRVIENEFIELLAKLPSYKGKKLFTVGPTNPIAPTKSSHECLDWLDKQPIASVVYISFGTTSTISDEQIEQLADGIQRSGQRFIWVLKDADLADIFADGQESRRRKLPENFEQETKGIGLLVKGWVPQLDVLAHPSTGAFMSHCGWNSCMEGLSMGLPIIAWPMHSDQPRNAIIVAEYLKAGVKVREWGRHKEVVSAAEVEDAIKQVMVLEEGKGTRKRAQAIGEAIRLAVTDGGCSRADMDSFVQHITRG